MINRGGRDPIKCSVAAVVRHPERPEILIVRRPLDDESLPGVWGLPAVSLVQGELPEAGLKRVGSEKLATEIEAVRLLGVDSEDRSGYRLILMDIEARILGGEPDVRRAASQGTRYIDSMWTADLGRLQEGSDLGSVCCRVLLNAWTNGVPAAP